MEKTLAMEIQVSFILRVLNYSKLKKRKSIYFSGGPLMAEDKSDPKNPFFYLSGLVSFGPQRCGTPGIQTENVYYMYNVH